MSYIDKNGNIVKRDKNAVAGQLSFCLEGNNLCYTPPTDEEYRAERKRETILAYYDAFLKMLEQYGNFNRYYPLWLEFESEKPSTNAIYVLNRYYGGDVSNIEVRLSSARHWLKEAITLLEVRAKKLGITSRIAYDEAYRDKERREKFRSYIKSEQKKVLSKKTSDVYSPEDLEARYQHWRATKSTKK